MKIILATLLVTYGLATQAAPERKPVVSARQKFNVIEISGYNAIYQDLQAGVDSQFLYLDIFENLSKGSEVPVHMQNLKKCGQIENATPATATQVAQLIRQDIAAMAEHLQSYEIDQSELQSIVAEYDKMTADFEKLFERSQLSTCEEESVPAYSDGQRDTVVRVDGRVLMILQLSKPD